jgi:hypothetical protein
MPIGVTARIGATAATWVKHQTKQRAQQAQDALQMALKLLEEDKQQPLHGNTRKNFLSTPL